MEKELVDTNLVHDHNTRRPGSWPYFRLDGTPESFRNTPLNNIRVNKADIKPEPKLDVRQAAAVLLMISRVGISQSASVQWASEAQNQTSQMTTERETLEDPFLDKMMYSADADGKTENSPLTMKRKVEDNEPSVHVTSTIKMEGNDEGPVETLNQSLTHIKHVPTGETTEDDSAQDATNSANRSHESDQSNPIINDSFPESPESSQTQPTEVTPQKISKTTGKQFSETITVRNTPRKRAHIKDWEWADPRPIPASWETASEADQTLWSMKNAGYEWSQIRQRWQEMTNQSTANS